MQVRRDTSYVTISEKLGVEYSHLYRVLHLRRSSPALLLTIERLYPFLIDKQDASIRDSLRHSCDFHRKAFKWDGKMNRYVMKTKYAKYK
jgi:hypothetical protein